jgi:hypothetical protein
VPPAVVALPAQGVQAAAVPVGVLASGQLQLPEDPATVGWWAGGAAPGSPAGTVVIAGHLDAADTGVGALAALLDVRASDLVELRDSSGGIHVYRVTARRSFAKAALPADLFDTAGPARLALITCGGEFDARRGRYRDNVVVLADPV